MRFIKLTFLFSILLGGASLAAAEPLKIAVIESLSGPQASSGQLVSTATRYVFDRANQNGGYNGAPIKVRDYDNGGTSAGASSMFRRAVADGVNVVVQGASSLVAGQLVEDVRRHNIRNPDNKVLYINTASEALDLRGEKCHYHAFHFSATGPMRIKPLLRVMHGQGELGERVYAINQNYSWGREILEATREGAREHGFQIVGSDLHDVNRLQDFSPYVAKIQASSPDSVITGNWSNDLLLLIKAANDANLNVRFGTVFLDQPGSVASAGKSVEGSYVVQMSNLELLDDEVVESYRKATGHYPVYVEPGTVNAMTFLTKALATLDFDNGAIDIDALAAALETVSHDNGIGTMRIRKDDHQVVMPMVVSRARAGAKFPADDTNIGFVPIEVVAGEDAVQPVQDSCKMNRP